MAEFINCPFCNDTDYDLMGLKLHLTAGHCEAFNSIELVQRAPLFSGYKSPMTMREIMDAEDGGE